MCGIVGAYHLKDGEMPGPALSWLERAKLYLAHRGPDTSGSSLPDKSTALGHTLLKIVSDSDEARQPRTSQRSSFAFNGELYNYRELAAEMCLSVSGESDLTDTAVFQTGLDHHGPRFLTKCVGMFAGAYFSRDDSALTLFRDRFGVKPLYYTVAAEIVYFCSEIRPLLEIQQAVALVPTGGQEVQMRTPRDDSDPPAYLGINQVPAGHLVRLAGGGITTTQWFDLSSSVSAATRPSSGRPQDSFEDLLVKALHLRLQAAAPVCVTLSGGLDSTTLYVLANERLGVTPTAFTYSHGSCDTSEQTAVESLVSHYAGSLRIVVEDDWATLTVQELVRDILALDGLPWGLVSRAHRQIYEAVSSDGYRVVVEGHGADEILGGYPHMLQALAAEAIWTGSFSIFLRSRKTIGVMRLQRQTPSQAIRSLVGWSRYLSVSAAFSHARVEAIRNAPLPMELRVFDRWSMRASVESRAPFLDQRVVLAALSLPLNEFISSSGAKEPLGRILRRYGHTELAENPRKMPFTTNLTSLAKDPKIRLLCQSVLKANSLGSRLASTRDLAVDHFSSEHGGWSQSSPHFMTVLACLHLLIVDCMNEVSPKDRSDDAIIVDCVIDKLGIRSNAC